MDISSTDFIFILSIISLYVWYSDELITFKKRFSVFFEEKGTTQDFVCPYKSLFFNFCKRVPSSFWSLIYFSNVCENPFYFSKRLIASLIIFYVAMSFMVSQILAFTIALSLSFLIIIFFIINTIRVRKKEFNNSLPSAIRLMKNSLQAGGSISEGLKIIVKETNGPLQEVFKDVLLKFNLGVSLEQVLKDNSNKIQSEEFSLFCSALIISFQNGGNLVSALTRFDKIITGRRTAQKKANNSITASKTEGFFAVCIILLISTFMLYTQEKAIVYFFHTPDGKAVFKFIIFLLFLNIMTIFFAIRWIKSQ